MLIRVGQGELPCFCTHFVITYSRTIYAEILLLWQLIPIIIISSLQTVSFNILFQAITEIYVKMCEACGSSPYGASCPRGANGRGGEKECGIVCRCGIKYNNESECGNERE